MEPNSLDIYKELFPDADIIHWTQLFRKMMFHTVKPDMLGRIGTLIPYQCRIEGDKVSTEQKLRLIIFDRAYIVAKLSRDTKVLKDKLTLEQWMVLMEEVYKHE